jgi:diguanylate cyclase (GGDEF)-like protein/PAS domain S-box-containing protein
MERIYYWKRRCAVMFGILLLAGFLISIVLIVLAALSWGIFRLPPPVMIPIARKLLVENMEDITFIVDSSDKVIDVNLAARRFLSRFSGKESGQEGETGYTGRSLGEILKMIPDTGPMGSKEEKYQDGLLVLEHQESTYYFKEYHAPIYNKKGFAAGRLYMLRDVTQAQEYVNRLKLLNEELLISDRIISSAVEGILITDSKGNILRVNEAFERMSGYRRKELLGSNPRLFKSGLHDEQFYTEMWNSIREKGYWEGEIWDRRKDGYLYPKWMSITSLKETEGSVEYYISISVDISNIKKAEEKLHKLAYYDSLTGIPNRTLFYEKLEQAIEKAISDNNMTVLLFMDLDGFKIINDSLGHAVGDLLLKEVAARIRSCIRKSDMVFRIGGDEFTIILEEIHDIDYVKNIAETIIHTIQLPYYIVGREMTLGVSIGIAIAPEDEADMEGLVRRADAAMYDAKEAGKGRYSFSSEEIERRNREILEMQMKLKKALEQNEFKLYLQPQISCVNGEYLLVGAEALIRWITSDGIIFTPDKFIPVSENNGMILPLGEWILEEILRINQELKKQGISLKLAVNLSSRQLEMDSFAEYVDKIMQEGRAQGIQLEMEITESFLLKDIDRAINTLLAIKQQGIQIALDDFGTGFSSLSYLTRLPIDYLKIDKSFIDDIADPRYKSLAPHIISMAKSLNIKTIAEGVELREQVERLLECGCDELQGYYFGKPMKLEDFISYARELQDKPGRMQQENCSGNNTERPN